MLPKNVKVGLWVDNIFPEAKENLMGKKKRLVL